MLEKTKASMKNYSIVKIETVIEITFDFLNELS
jgi:hypothetical protein